MLSMIDGSKLLRRSCKPFSRRLGKNQLQNCDHDALASKKKVVMQLLVFSLMPMTAEKKAQGLVGKICRDIWDFNSLCKQTLSPTSFAM